MSKLEQDTIENLSECFAAALNEARRMSDALIDAADTFGRMSHAFDAGDNRKADCLALAEKCRESARVRFTFRNGKAI